LASAGTEICVCHVDVRSLFHLSQVPAFLNQDTSQSTRVAPDAAEPWGVARIADENLSGGTSYIPNASHLGIEQQRGARPLRNGICFPVKQHHSATICIWSDG